MIVPERVKQFSSCKLLALGPIADDVWSLDAAWQGLPPRAGQFFMVKPNRSSVLLGRPLSSAGWILEHGNTGGVRFLVAQRGKGTQELLSMRSGQTVELTGPLGNAWAGFLPEARDRRIALVGGGIGIAPLLALERELPPETFDFYAGFRSAPFGLEGVKALSLVTASENGTAGKKGMIPDFLDPSKYSAVYACGPEAMLKAVAARCGKTGTPCFISMEKHMACGVGACLGCTVKTKNGNKRCCADGPIFPAEDVIFDE